MSTSSYGPSSRPSRSCAMSRLIVAATAYYRPTHDRAPAWAFAACDGTVGVSRARLPLDTIGRPPSTGGLASVDPRRYSGVQIGPINPDPSLLGGAGGLVTQVLGLVMYICLVVCVIAGLASGGMIAVGGVSRNVEMRSAGMRGLIYSIVGVVVIGSIVVIMNTVFSRAHS